jgi:uncharacterized membrane protein YidH (DUF202 family)
MIAPFFDNASPDPHGNRACVHRYSSLHYAERMPAARAAPSKLQTNQFNNNERTTMNSIKMIGIVLIVAGLLGAALGGFSFTRDTHKASLGPIKLSVAEEKKVNIPLWASLAAIVAGAAALAAGSKR